MMGSLVRKCRKWQWAVAGIALLSTSTLFAQSYKAGTYICEASGNNGNVQVEVLVSDVSIESVQILKHDETPGLGAVAVDMIAQSIVDEQSIEVDALTGATLSSQAVLDAVSECLEQAQLTP